MSSAWIKWNSTCYVTDDLLRLINWTIDQYVVGGVQARPWAVGVDYSFSPAGLHACADTLGVRELRLRISPPDRLVLNPIEVIASAPLGEMVMPRHTKGVLIRAVAYAICGGAIGPIEISTVSPDIRFPIKEL